MDTEEEVEPTGPSQGEEHPDWVQVKEAAANGEASALYKVLLVYSNGSNQHDNFNLKANPTKAYEWSKKAVEFGAAMGWYFLAHFNCHPDGVEGYDKSEFSIQKGLEYFEIAARNGINYAAYRLGTLYEQEQNAFHDNRMAYMWYMECLKNTHNNRSLTGSVLIQIGEFLHYGLGVQANVAASYSARYESALLESNIAFENVGFMLERGRGISQNFDASIYFYSRGVHVRSPMSKVNMGIYQERGLLQNSFFGSLNWTSEDWFAASLASDSLGVSYKNDIRSEKALADSGDPLAAVFAAMLYMYGLLGCKHNFHKAMNWIEIAAKAGDALAIKRLDVYNTVCRHLYKAKFGPSTADLVVAYTHSILIEPEHPHPELTPEARNQPIPLESRPPNPHLHLMIPLPGGL